MAAFATALGLAAAGWLSPFTGGEYDARQLLGVLGGRCGTCETAAQSLELARQLEDPRLGGAYLEILTDPRYFHSVVRVKNAFAELEATPRVHPALASVALHWASHPHPRVRRAALDFLAVHGRPGQAIDETKPWPPWGEPPAQDPFPAPIGPPPGVRKPRAAARALPHCRRPRP